MGKFTAKIAVFMFAVSLAACKPQVAQESVNTAQPEENTMQNTPAAESGSALLNPALAKEKAPEKFKVRFKTTKGDFVIETTRKWAPVGADRFYNLAKIGYFKDIAFFRVVSGFMVQFGIHGNPEVSAKWKMANLQDDIPAGQSNKRGYITYATAGPNTRTTQLFINYVDNNRLDSMGFIPFGQVVDGMNIVDGLYSGYGDGAPSGRGPDQGRIQSEGNSYLKKDFTSLDYILSAGLE